ncbi:FMN-binding protein [Krasilnikovia sp. MM14-A1259]|uniref:FMN-binding protein n=1 Tax=Krasilnikovia sp. MM14-A1259 TaxID=3373539 RepID=UPI00382CCF58
MRRITLWIFSTVAALVLLFSYRTSTMGAGGTTATAAAAVLPATPDSPTAGATPQATSGPGQNDATPQATGSAGSGGTYQGSIVQTRWGPIQVTVTVSGGKITDIAVPTYPNGNHRDAEINAYALPALREATLNAQSADIDSISGATVTSDGYKQSLQSALDAAHL